MFTYDDNFSEKKIEELVNRQDNISISRLIAKILLSLQTTIHIISLIKQTLTTTPNSLPLSSLLNIYIHIEMFSEELQKLKQKYGL